MEFNYGIDHDHRLILVRRSGNWNADQFIDSFESLRKAVTDCHDYSLVSEMRDLHALLSPGDVTRISEYVSHHPIVSGETILIVNKPLETALAMLYKNATHASLNIRIFSTSEGVTEHLGLNIESLLNTYLTQAAKTDSPLLH